MSEQNKEPKIMRLNINGEWYEARQDNTTGWLHENPDHHKYDNIYIENQDDPEEEADGVYVWRTDFDEGSPHFDTLIKFMEDNGYSVHLQEEVSEYDRLAYHKENDEVRTYELTPRLEETVRRFGEAILNIPDWQFWDNIEAETERPYPEKWV